MRRLNPETKNPSPLRWQVMSFFILLGFMLTGCLESDKASALLDEHPELADLQLPGAERIDRTVFADLPSVSTSSQVKVIQQYVAAEATTLDDIAQNAVDAATRLGWDMAFDEGKESWCGSRTTASDPDLFHMVQIQIAEIPGEPKTVYVELLVAGRHCRPPTQPTGSVTFYNDSEETVLFLSANGPTATLENAVKRWSWNPSSIGPGGSQDRSFDVHTGNGRPGKYEPWCVNTTYYVVKSKSGRFFQADLNAEVPDPVFEASDLEILEQLGPGWCWPERETEYHYTGD